MNELDDVTQMQMDWFRCHRETTRWIIVQELAGFSVHEHLIDGVAPSTLYPTRELAAARLLQLMGIVQPIAPQDHPESVCIGTIQEKP